MSTSVSRHQIKIATIIGSLGGIFALCAVGAPQLLAIIVVIFLFSSIIWARARSLQVPTIGPILAFLIPLTLALVNSHLSFMPVFPDADLYSQLASRSAHAWWRGELLGADTYYNLRVRTYAYLLGVVYAVSGNSQLTGIVVNAGFWGLATVYWLRIGRSTLSLSRSSTGIAGLMFACYPAAILYSSSLLRESITIFLLAVGSWHISRWTRLQETRHLVMGLGTGLVMALLRPELLPAIWFAVSGGLLISNLSRIPLLRAGGIGGLALFGMILFQSLNVHISGYLNPFRLSLLEAKRAAEAARPHAYLTGMEYSSWFDVITAIPIRVVYLLFSPFPWQLHSYELFIVTVDAFYVLGICLISSPSLLWGVIDRRADRLFLIGFAMLLVVGYSLVISTEGVASRRRLYAMPILFLFATYEIRRRFGEIQIT